MARLFESNVPFLCFSNISKAKQVATQNSLTGMNTIIEIWHIAICLNHLEFVGRANRNMLKRLTSIDNSNIAITLKLEEAHIEHLYTTWVNILSHDIIGYLTLSDIGNVKIIKYDDIDSESEYSSIIIKTDRVLFSLSNCHFGKKMCLSCCEQIGEKRVIAVPETLFCTECKSKMEEK